MNIKRIWVTRRRILGALAALCMAVASGPAVAATKRSDGRQRQSEGRAGNMVSSGHDDAAERSSYHLRVP